MVQITYNLNKIKVQISMANDHFGTIPVREYLSVENDPHTLSAFR